MDGMRVFESLEAEYLRIEFENRFHLDRTITQFAKRGHSLIKKLDIERHCS